MKKISFLAAIIAIVLVGASSFINKTFVADYGYISLEGNGDIKVVDLAGLTEGVLADYHCSSSGTCLIQRNSGTVIDDPSSGDPNRKIIQSPDFSVITEGTFNYHKQ